MISTEVYMDICSLKRQGLKNSAIARKLGIDVRTVRKYLKNAEAPAYRKIQRQSKLEDYKPLIEGWLAQEDYQATRIHELLQGQGFEGSYDIVQRFVKRIKERRDRQAYIRFETMPGQQAQVDFGDFQITENDGSIRTVYAFVMTLGFSRHMYVEFLERCTLPNFLAAHAHAFAFFGGVPAEILYDNMKQVVIKRQGSCVKWNPAFEAFMLHYKTKPMLAPPYAPWVKGKVERPIKYIRERFWRGYSYSDLVTANRDVRHWLRRTAFHRIHGTTRQKVSERFEAEGRSLGFIPDHPYDLSLRYSRLVHKDCQVCFEGNRYVVPHHLVGKRLVLRVRDGRIRFFDDANLVTVYRIPDGKGRIQEHPRFYQHLKEDRQQQARKYRKPSGKAKATRGILKSEANVEVMKRSLAVYEEVCA